jgi:hypothetical protein
MPHANAVQEKATVDNQAVEKIPHIENVDLVPQTHAGPGPAGFDASHSLGLTLGILMMMFVAYLVFG